MTVDTFDRASEVAYGVAGSSDDRVLTYLAKGTDDDIEVLDYAEDNTPLTYDGMPRSDIRLQQILPFQFRVEATYSRDKSQPKREADPTVGTAELQFTFGLERQRVLYALETVAVFPGGSPTFNDAIGVQGSGPDQIIEGAESVVPVGGFVVNFDAPSGFITGAYRDKIESLIGKINNATFYGRAPGEVMFVGASGRVVSTGQVSLQLAFDVKKLIVFPVNGRTTIAGIAIPNATTISQFDVVWVRYRLSAGATGAVQKAASVHIARVTERGNFADLALPGA